MARGYVQGLIKFHYGQNAAIVVSSLLFAIMHGMNPGTFDSPFPIINLTLAGVLLAVSREVSGGLWMPIGIHLTWNYFQGYIFGFQVSGTETAPALLETTITGSQALSGGSFGVEGSFITTLILILGIVAVRYMYRSGKSAY
ncbi:CAAX amino terminal protease self- immunity [compost metagenome]